MGVEPSASGVVEAAEASLEVDPPGCVDPSVCSVEGRVSVSLVVETAVDPVEMGASFKVVPPDCVEPSV